MLQSTEGIILHTIKHSDSGVVAHILTAEKGRLSFIAKGTNNKKGKTRKVYFQAGQIVHIEYYDKNKTELQFIKELTPSVTYCSIPFDVVKNTVLLFLCEVLYKSVRNSEQDRELYNYIKETFLFLDGKNSPNPNFHLAFLIGLSRYLGIVPRMPATGTGNEYFDMESGEFRPVAPLHGYYLEKEYSGLLLAFLNTSMRECGSIELSGRARTEFLNMILTFFSLHLPGMKNIKSLEVLSEIFS
jgi:DNA repair protein RecO (recombination protein O)